MSRAQLTAALQAAAQHPDGGAWALQALGNVPGCSWAQAEKSLFGREKSPAGLTVGEWRFEPTVVSGLPGVRVVHAVGGLRLAETEATLESCAQELAGVIADRVQALGTGAQTELAAVTEGLARAAEEVGG